MKRIITRDRSLIPACDIDNLDQFEKLLEATGDVPGIGAYKIGFDLGLHYGLPIVAGLVHGMTNKPVIYDHQKAGTDIPKTGINFARRMARSKVDYAILFPQAGPATEKAWIEALQQEGVGVIVGGWMTHPEYAKSEGGFLTNEGILNMYRIAADAGVTHFVVPGTKPDAMKEIKSALEGKVVRPVFYSPGFIAQKGDISQARAIAGERFHGIVGEGVYNAPDMRAAALELTSKLD